ncbi:unnamed protein product [Cladocopium goreaui]|uniref:Uncharacterized protein n=1 Tax=Cladocopium goreaui TaxID=2562237 RepID=A0A9P1C3A4_9DINO|nr:unnamed protein product [Cladocopium goreaui]
MAQRIPSFVPPPAAAQPPVQVAWAPSPGLPSPEVIQKQKEGYVRLLDEQLKQGQNTLDQQRKQQSEYLHTQAQQQKQQVEMQIKQQVQQQEMQLLQQYNQSLMQVQQASAQQKAALESQAMQLVMEYQQKRSQEEMLAKQQQLQRGHIEGSVPGTNEICGRDAKVAGYRWSTRWKSSLVWIWSKLLMHLHCATTCRSVLVRMMNRGR